ncbi:MAG TPA: toll/interleukin-1 receptor domain-containing protein, partial [Chitinophagaceae bacterium]|nr:toll/interleukin-1 receptor domain-containing protein [Chitinophagaceae bacterium]
MAYIPGYPFDIFISYSHVDNATNSGVGWIEQFYKCLNLSLAKRIGQMDVIRIWWDSGKLDGSKLFDQSIADGINQSAIMISLVSAGYLKSDYCNKELDLFTQKSKAEPAGPKIGDRRRIFNVLLNNIPFDQWPPELAGATGFPFHDAGSKEEFGDPLNATDPRFTDRIKALREALIAIFEDFKKVQVSPGPAPAPATPSPAGPVLFFGEVADTLRSARKRTISDLEKDGYTIVSGMPPPDGGPEHDTQVKQAVCRADLSIHLLDTLPGREVTDQPDQWYTQKQTEISLKYAKSTLLWVPAELDMEAIEEQQYQKFLKGLESGQPTSGKYDFIRGAKSTLTQDISDVARPFKHPQPPPAPPNQVQVLLDTHLIDQLGAMDLGKYLVANQIQPYINPQEDDPKKNTQILADRISQVTKLIFYYGKVSREWVLERMNAALQLVVANNFPIEEFYLYLAPPFKDP